MTKCLDLDTGNTRAKWRLDDRSGWLLSPRLPDVSERESRIRVSNVAGDFKVIEGWLYETYGIRPEFAETKATMAGVTCGYLEPAKLGIDRWLGIIAAWNKTLVNCVVIGIGTALSVDFVTVWGIHLGGYIAPGPAAMSRSLNVETSLLDVGHSPTETLEPGKETVAAVNNSILLMIKSFLSHCFCWFQSQLQGEFKVFATGGNAEVIFSHMDCAIVKEPELVLDGLNLALP